MDALVTVKKTVAAKSIADLVKAHSGGLANVSATLILDVSGSMNEGMRNGRRKIDGLRDVVKQIQDVTPTTMVMFGGNNYASFDTQIPEPQGGTPMHCGLAVARDAGVSRAIVISDGQPNDELSAMEIGKSLGRCDCIFVGDATGHGREFMRRLAEATGGTMFDGDLAEVKTLVAHIAGLLGDGQ